jgi:ATP-dependent Clp protease ATP-binding subunit ClpA
MTKVVKKFIDELNTLVKDKNIHVKPNADAVEFLIKKGFDSKMGARPLQRAIDELIKKPLSKEILFGKLTNGGVVEIAVENDTLKLNVIDVLPVVKVKDESAETDNI